MSGAIDDLPVGLEPGAEAAGNHVANPALIVTVLFSLAISQQRIASELYRIANALERLEH